MAFWIEIRCENRNVSNCDNGQGPAFIQTENCCWSHTNDGAGDLYDELIPPKELMELVTKHAKNAGFTLTDKGWICPYCSKLKGNS